MTNLTSNANVLSLSEWDGTMLPSKNAPQTLDDDVMPLNRRAGARHASPSLRALSPGQTNGAAAGGEGMLTLHVVELGVSAFVIVSLR